MRCHHAHLICFSPTHSSHLIGEAIIKGTEIEHVTETDLTYEKPSMPLVLTDVLVVIAVPVYAGRLPDVALERMENIQGENTPALLAVIYGNRDYDDALLELRDWSCAHGFIPLAGAAFVGEHSYSRPGRPIAAGRPDENDLRIARDFGRHAAFLLEEADHFGTWPALQVKGNFPYKEKKTKTLQSPLTRAELCTQCGFCVEICPVHAIHLEKDLMTDANLCIKCCACLKQCPNGARVFDTPYTDLLFKNFSARREPELFYSK